MLATPNTTTTNDRKDDKKDRYSRQTILKEIGEKGQDKLGKSSVVVIGCGGLGGTIASSLVRAGVGYIRIVDRDFVELNNLHRQQLFDERDVGQAKAVAAAEKLKSVNSAVEVEGLVEDVNPTSIEKIIDGMDLVLDGTDNMETRFVINDACVKHKIPWVYGGAIGTYGMTMSILPGKTPCLRCVFPELPPPGSLPTCELVGVLNTIPTIIASIETTEALKILLANKDINENLIVYDCWRHSFNTIKIRRNNECKCCSKREFEFLTVSDKAIITPLCGADAMQIIPVHQNKIAIEDLASKLRKIGKVKSNPLFLVFKTGSYELKIFWNARAVIYGTKDKRIAKSLYAKYVGV